MQTFGLPRHVTWGAALASRPCAKFDRTRIEIVLPASADDHHAAFEAASFARMSAPMLPAILDADALTESRARCA